MGQCQSTDVGADTLLEEEAQAAGSLVCRSQARTFPPVPGKATVLDYASSASAAEECAFFLEQVVSVPGIDDAMRACASSRLPYVRVWVESGGKTLGEVAEWPSRPSSHPSWFSARKLGLRMAAALSATLRIEVCDGSTVLGSAQTNMKDLRVHQRIELAADVRPGVQKSSVVFQILDCQAVLRPKSVYLIRHGESEWNKAQRSLNLHGMVRTTDHPLSAKGRDQAEALRHLLQMELDKAGSDKADPSVAPMLQPGLILASPLGRALQTAIIAYGPLLEKAKLGRNELVLAPNCKEKQNFGGLDTVCTKLGEEILQSSQEELRVLYSRLEKDKFIVDAFRQLRFDVEEVQERWWPEGQAESTGQLKARMREFMYQLLFSSQESLVIFGHSLFFQQLMREFLSDDVRKSVVGQQLSKSKLPNCGVVRLQVDPSRMLSGPFVEAELVLGTEMVTADSFSLNCCAESADLQDELRIDAVSLNANGTLETIPEEGPEEVGQSPGRSPETEPVAAAALDTQGVQEPVTKPSGPNQASQAPAKPAEPPGTSTKKPAKKCCPF